MQQGDNNYEHTWSARAPNLNQKRMREFGKPPKTQNRFLKMLGEPFVESFDFMIKSLQSKDLATIEFNLRGEKDQNVSKKPKIKFSLSHFKIEEPSVPDKKGVRVPIQFPKECRLGGETYKGKVSVTVDWSVNGKIKPQFHLQMGEIPIMVRSKKCNLGGLPPKMLVENGEHEQDWGGYFVVKGNQRLIRMVSATRKNYPLTIQRETFKGRGKLFTDMGVYIRCVKEDFTSTNNVLHYLQNGTVKLMVSFKKKIHLLPLMMVLRALTDQPDSYIATQLTLGMEDDSYYTGQVTLMLQHLQEEKLTTQKKCRESIGKDFRIKMNDAVAEFHSDEQACEIFLKSAVCIHLDKDSDKFHLLAFMTRKLFSYIQGKCAVEGMDPVMMQELTLGGHLYLQLIKDRLSSFLSNLKLEIIKKERNQKNTDFIQDDQEIINLAKKAGSLRFGTAFDAFLATGNVPAAADLGLGQSTGFSIIAENINRMRYMSHFRAVHRGATFMTSRSSDVRQLKPDAWGFLCPVHTPDGSPCGLLNHLSSTCQVVNERPDTSKLENELVALGMRPYNDTPLKGEAASYFVVMHEGRMIGWVADSLVEYFVNELRKLKVDEKRVQVPKTLEIAYVPRTPEGQFPGIFLFSAPARMMRPVHNLATRSVELIGTFEQVYLNISITKEERYEGITTHEELSETGFLSNLACLIPLPDFNQSPRNMYQCQMAKQTMGSPCHNWRYQTDNKLYRIQTPTTPLLRPGHWDRIDMDDFAVGTNAVVAVISYTGYDMEDAMVINHASLDRGFAHGQVYKTEFIDLTAISSAKPGIMQFKLDPAEKSRYERFIDEDGLPFVGMRLQPADPYYSYYNIETKSYRVVKYKGQEEVYVDKVVLCNSHSEWGNGDSGLEETTSLVKICVTLRIPRNPQIGDKFASRAGQKGICSQQWLCEDLPFTETGLQPDIIFNPHGFPSRMTIAMMIECMAGKSGSVHGIVHDATPFRFSEDNTAIDYHGKLLEQAGYDYYGTETLYSGIDGRMMEARIFTGVVHYQRLRHMVSDKFQVRRTGKVDPLTHQPVKGRKAGGGVRFGEMERDALISHGSNYLLYDRLLNCSDQSDMDVCQDCGTFIPPQIELPTKGVGSGSGAYTTNATLKKKCRICPNGGRIANIIVPYVFKYLVAELGSVNLRSTINVSHV